MVQNSKLFVYFTVLVVIVLAHECSAGGSIAANNRAFSIGPIKHEKIIALTNSKVVDAAEELRHSPSKQETVQHLRKRRQSDDDDLRFILCLLEYYEGLGNNSHCNTTDPGATDYSSASEWLEARNQFYKQTCKPECIEINKDFIG